jgi:DNA-binding transcriptional regulator LsrR (DeoR family)
MKKRSGRPISQGVELHKLVALLEQLVAIQLYAGGATQPEIADNMNISAGKVNSLVKGWKHRKAMQKNRKRAALTAEDKLYKAVQALFILEARQLDMGNKEIREILGVDRANVDAVAKAVNKALKKFKKPKR